MHSSAGRSAAPAAPLPPGYAPGIATAYYNLLSFAADSKIRQETAPQQF